MSECLAPVGTIAVLSTCLALVVIIAVYMVTRASYGMRRAVGALDSLRRKNDLDASCLYATQKTLKSVREQADAMRYRAWFLEQFVEIEVDGGLAAFAEFEKDRRALILQREQREQREEAERVSRFSLFAVSPIAGEHEHVDVDVEKGGVGMTRLSPTLQVSHDDDQTFIVGDSDSDDEDEEEVHCEQGVAMTVLSPRKSITAASPASPSSPADLGRKLA